MGGTKNGGKKIADKLTREDPDYYRKLRSKRKSYPKHDGQFDKDSAKEAGKKGGEVSRRPKAKKLPREV
jgi:general stress protein YciG